MYMAIVSRRSISELRKLLIEHFGRLENFHSCTKRIPTLGSPEPYPPSRLGVVIRNHIPRMMEELTLAFPLPSEMIRDSVHQPLLYLTNIIPVGALPDALLQRHGEKQHTFQPLAQRRVVEGDIDS